MLGLLSVSHLFCYLGRSVVAPIGQCNHRNKSSIHLTNLFDFKVKTERTARFAHDKGLIQTDPNHNNKNSMARLI